MYYPLILIDIKEKENEFNKKSTDGESGLNKKNKKNENRRSLLCKHRRKKELIGSTVQNKAKNKRRKKRAGSSRAREKQI